MASFEPDQAGEPIRPKPSQTSRKTFECKPCNKVFKEESGLRKHNKVKHEGNGDDVIRCKTCSKEFSYAWNKENITLTKLSLNIVNKFLKTSQ